MSAQGRGVKTNNNLCDSTCDKSNLGKFFAEPDYSLESRPFPFPAVLITLTEWYAMLNSARKVFSAELHLVVVNPYLLVSNREISTFRHSKLLFFKKGFGALTGKGLK